jgi:DNA-binding transcriptional MerR regulator
VPRDKAEHPVRLYYRIGEVAGLVGVEPHVLRYWESEFPTIRPQKSRSGQRVYSRKDVEKLLRVKDLLYGQGFTIAGARQRLRIGLVAAGSPDQAEPQALVEDRFSRGLGSVSEAREEGCGPAAREYTSALRATLVALREEVRDMLLELERDVNGPSA